MQEAPVRRLNVRDRYLCENPDFLSSWPLIFQAACKCPDWWPARETAIVEERMFSEHHWEPPLYGRGSLSFTLIIPLIGNPNARSSTQANLLQVCESTEITYDTNVVNFSGKDKHCARRLQEVCTRLSLIYFCSCSNLFGDWILAGMR
jgi:hypothetical protein